MKRLLDLFGVLVLVLLLSAFDERGAEQTVVRARAGLDDVWTRLSPRAETPSSSLPTEAVDNGLRGQFAAVDERSPWTLLPGPRGHPQPRGPGVTPGERWEIR